MARKGAIVNTYGVRRVAVFAFAGVAALSLLGVARAVAVDVSGRWLFTFVDESISVTEEVVITLAQTGTTITVTNSSGYDGGTIDPDTGALHLEGGVGCLPEPAIIDAVASADGMTIAGTFADSVRLSRTCFRISGPVHATRIPDTCGNGVVDPGEACDGGAAGTPCCTEYCAARPAGTACPVSFVCSASAQCDGTGACVDTPKAAGALCRLATHPCDTPETCDGVSLECPPETSPTEPDVDQDGVLDGCDFCLGAPLENVRLTVGSFQPDAPKDFLKLRASVRLPAGSFLNNPQVHPEFLSKIVTLRDATGRAIVEERIPGTTLVDPSPTFQWKQHGRRWTFINRGTPLTQVLRMQMGPSRRDPTLWDVRVVMRNGVLPDDAGPPPYAVEVELYRTGFPSQECGRLVFGPPGTASLSCSAPNPRGVIRCR